MAFTATEWHSGRQLDGGGAKREYILTGTGTEAEARTALLGEAPSSIDGHPRKDNECQVEELDNAVGYRGVAIYGNFSFDFTPPAPGSFDLSFDIGLESVHITHSLQTMDATAAAGDTAPDYKGAINVQSDGTVEGADIGAPHFQYEISYTFTDAEISQSYVLTLSDIVGTVNDATFHGFAAGELLLVGVSGRQHTANDDWTLTFRFAVSRNKTGIVIGGMDPIDKKGWEFLWVRFSHHTSNNALVKIPRAAYAERVYPITDYDDLGI